MQKGRFNVVTDGQYGSCGKGLIASALAWKHRPEILSTTNYPNAGHRSVFTDGRDFVAKAIPSPSVLTKWVPGYRPHVIIGAGAAFNIDRLFEEIQECGVNYSLSIHPRAAVVTEAHRQTEAGNGPNSTKHIASTMQGSAACVVEKIMRLQSVKLARDYPELSGHMAIHMARKLSLPLADQDAMKDFSLPQILHTLMVNHNYTILHEGAQGFSLDVNHGQSYPTCTSRGTTATQNMADMGISHFDLGDIYLVIRPYPIRVGNVVVNGEQLGYSGDCYHDQKEMTWEQVANEAGMPADVAASLTKTELTTVTKRLRRVFSFSDHQLREAALVNGATKIALNFANYIDYSVSGVNEYEKLTKKVKDFIVRVEDITKLPVTMVGTGPRVDQVVML